MTETHEDKWIKRYETLAQNGFNMKPNGIDWK